MAFSKPPIFNYIKYAINRWRYRVFVLEVFFQNS